MLNFNKLENLFGSHYNPSLSIQLFTFSSTSGSCNVTAGHLLTGSGPSLDGIGAVASQATLFSCSHRSENLSDTSNLQNSCQSNLLLQCSSSKSASSSVMKSHLRFFADSNAQISSRIFLQSFLFEPLQLLR